MFDISLFPPWAKVVLNWRTFIIFDLLWLCDWWKLMIMHVGGCCLQWVTTDMLLLMQSWLISSDFSPNPGNGPNPCNSIRWNCCKGYWGWYLCISLFQLLNLSFMPTLLHFTFMQTKIYFMNFEIVSCKITLIP